MRTISSPGGYITYLVWEKVPGDSLDRKGFWSYPISKREEIRHKFCEAYKYVLGHSDYDKVPRANRNQEACEMRISATHV